MDEKQEKFDEKEMQKHDEKSADEKNYEEKYRRDPLGTLIWAVILIWAGLVMLAGNLGFLDRLNIRFSDSNFPFEFPFANTWGLFFVGAGLILLIEIVIRLVIPTYRRPVMGTFILAIVFFGIGLGSWELIWPLIIIAVGLSLILRGVFRSRGE
jgi:hypothetical protein